jgi:hypothetical protein
MGFGTKTDLATGRKIDLDKSYKLLIKPVVEGKGITCVRADEIPHSGVIDVPMYEELLNADLVIADISTANCNAIYELGIRHALRPRTTIVISESQLKYPFDLNHVLITSYVYLDGGGIDYEEVMRFRDLLGKMIDELLVELKVDSPVYTYLAGLTPPSLAAAVAAAAIAGAAVLAMPAATSDGSAPSAADPTLSMLIQLGEQAITDSDFALAKTLFARAIGINKPKLPEQQGTLRQDPYLIQRLALATYKAKQPDRPSTVKALYDALAVLDPLKPDESNDPETVGLSGAIEKRLFDNGEGLKHLDRAIERYTRGYYLRMDYYNGINCAYLQNVRTETARDPTDADKIADLVYANRIRREVLELCDRELLAIEKSRQQPAAAEMLTGPETAQIKEDQKKSDRERSFWILATKAEAYFGLGEMANYQEARFQALAIDPPPAHWMIDTFDFQIARLKGLLEAHGHLLEPPWPAQPDPNVHAV